MIPIYKINDLTIDASPNLSHSVKEAVYIFYQRVITIKNKLLQSVPRCKTSENKIVSRFI